MPVQLMHTDKADSVKAVSVRGVHLAPMSVGVAECVKSRELLILSFNRLITLLQGAPSAFLQ